MYRTVAASFWTDPKVRQLTFEGKGLLLYLITNPHTHVSGIYLLPKLIMQLETGLTKSKLDTLCHTLSSLGFCAFDGPKDVVWVRKMMAYQGKGEKNARSAARHIIEDLHNSFLCKEFIESYPNVTQYMDGVEVDTLSHRVSESGTPDPDPDPDTRLQITEQKPDLGRRKLPAPAVLEVTPEMAVFAAQNGVEDVDRETEAMLDHFRAKGEFRADWLATWRTWIRNSKRFGGTRERHKTKTDRNHENAEKLLSRFDFEDGGGGIR